MRGLRGVVVVVLALGAAAAEAQACSIERPQQVEGARATGPSLTSAVPPDDPRADVDDATELAEAEVLPPPPGVVTVVGSVSVRLTRVLRGDLREGEAREVGTLTDCGPTTGDGAKPGERFGYVDDQLVDLATYRAATAPYPAARGRGRAGVLVVGRFGDATIAALDRRGRVLAYGRGGSPNGALARCPDGRRVVQAGRTIVARRLTDLSVTGSAGLPGLTTAARCLDAQGSAALLVTGADDRTRLVVVRSNGRRVRTLAVGRGGALGAQAALVAGVGLVPYDGGPVRRVSQAPGLATGAAADARLRRVVTFRVLRDRLVLTQAERGLRIELGIERDRTELHAPASLLLDARGRPLVGHRGALRRYEDGLQRWRLLAAADRFADVGPSGAWAVDARGRLHHGLRRLGPLPRLDAGPLLAVDAVVE